MQSSAAPRTRLNAMVQACKYGACNCVQVTDQPGVLDCSFSMLKPAWLQGDITEGVLVGVKEQLTVRTCS